MAPKKKVTKRKKPTKQNGGRRMTRKQMEGEGIIDIVKGVNKFLRKHRVISRGAKLLSPVAGKHKTSVRTIGKVAKQLGYGKR